jgi:hypothetical protein
MAILNYRSGVCIQGLYFCEEKMRLKYDDVVTVLRALYWYEDKLTNMERAKGRDDAEWDDVVWLRKRLSDYIKAEAYIR